MSRREAPRRRTGNTVSDAPGAGGEANQAITVSGWPELVSVALLGTERREPPAFADQVLAGLAGRGGAEDRLLSAAGSLAVFRRAGRLARPAPPLPEPAPAETLPACGPAAAARLSLLLDDHRALLPEWLRAVGQRGLRVPAERLPDLLEAATANQALRGDVEAVLGERGRWLAAQAPRWGWAAPLPGAEAEREALWLAGPRPQRRRLFAMLRRTRPDEARQLLERGWSREEAADRAWFTAAFGEGLAPADEPLLESALDDRRQEVRAAAGRLLARLPGSAFARRMTERTVPLVRVEGGAWLRVTLPDELGESAARDGIIRRPPRGTGERAWWLLQLVASTPLSAWDAVGLSPELADPRHAAPVALERLRAGDTGIAERLQAPWPRELSEEALDLLVRLASRGHWLHRLIAERLDPALADEAAGRLGSVEPGITQVGRGRDLVLTLFFRRDMHEELH